MCLFLGNLDLATCLVPQFLDLLRYGRELFTSGQVDQRSQIDDIHRSFNTFLVTIILIHSSEGSLKDVPEKNLERAL